MSLPPVSVELEMKAYNDSTKEITTLLDSTAQLDSMDVIMSKVNQKLASLQTQLGAVMQTQLDELSESLNTIRCIKESTTSIKTRFDEVRKNCSESLRSLGTNKEIDKLYVARRNVMSVVNQIKFMEELPDRISVMTKRIKEDYTCLKVIYDEWIGYYAWMWKVKEQIERISIQSTREQAEEIYSSSFAAITALGSVIDEKLWEHIYRCMELAHLDPAALVRALTIIEKNQHRKNRAAEMQRHGEKVAAWVLNDREWVEECKDHLLTAIHRRCEHAYNQAATMKDKLRIGMQLLADLENVRAELVPCFPPHYNILQFFITQYAVIANNNMQPYYDDPTLEPGEILVLVEWLDSFLEEVQGWGCEPVAVFVEAKERLMQKFESSCTSRMEIWFKRILERRDVPMESEEGHLVTAVPEDLFSLIKTQAELAAEHLKDKALCGAIRICTAPLHVYTEFYTALIQDENGDVSDRELSAIINNSNQLRELVEGLPDLVGSELNEEALVDLNTQLSETTKQLVDLNTLAAHALGDMIIGDVDSSHILDELCFNEDWLVQEEAEGVLVMTSTFQDYFNDLKVWIQSKFFFGMVVIDCLHNSVKRYFKSFEHSKTAFDEPITFGCRVKTDYDSLMSFFTSDAVANAMKFTDRRYRSGEHIAEILSPIRNLEIFFKQPPEAIVVNGEITGEGYSLLLSLVGGKLMENGIRVLMMARSDIDPVDKTIIINKFSMFSCVCWRRWCDGE